MKDFPLNLKLNAAAIRLARALYYGRQEVWGDDNRIWDALSTKEKHAWIQRAADVLLSIKKPVTPPISITTGLRPTHAPVIGMIQPAHQQGA